MYFKRICTTLLLMLCLIPAFGQLTTQAKWGWAKNTGGQTIDLVSDSLGNLCVLGNHTADVTIEGQTISGAGAYVAFYDSTAQFLSLKSIASEGVKIDKLATDNFGNFYACGSFTGTVKSGAFTLVSKGQSDGILIKLDSKGNVLEATSFGAEFADAVNDLVVDLKGNKYVLVRQTKTYYGSDNVLDYINRADVYKIDNINKTLWTKPVNTTGSILSNTGSISSDDNGFIYTSVSVSYSSDKNTKKLFLTKLDEEGNTIWTREHGNSVSSTENVSQ